MVRTVEYGAGRETLLEAAVLVVAERGLRGMTFRAVADRAGVNNSLIAHHFGTRDALISASLEWAVERAIETTSLLDLESETAFSDAFMDSLRVFPELQVFQYEMILESRRNPALVRPVARLYDRYRAVTEESLRAFGIRADVSDTAMATFVALDGVVVQYLAGTDEGVLRRTLHQVWAVLDARRALPDAEAPQRATR